MALNPAMAFLRSDCTANDSYVTLLHAFVVLDWNAKQEFLQQ